MSNSESSLPPGFRFHPTDEELIVHYLRKRAASTPCPVSIIAEVDIYKFNPWDLPAKAQPGYGKKEWYFFSPRDRKYPNGDRPNRAAGSGYWKATGTDKLIMATGRRKENIGVKKSLVFYKGRAPKGLKTNWIMHEYRLAEATNPINNTRRMIKSNDRQMRLDDWVLCRIYIKANSLPTMATMEQEQQHPFVETAALATLPNITNQNTLQLQQSSSSSCSNLLPPAEFPLLTRFLVDNPSKSTLSELGPVFTNGNLNNNHCFIPPELHEQESSVLEMGNQLKALPSTGGNFDDGVSHPSKEFNDSCTFTTINDRLDTPQYHLLNHIFYNQQILLNSHLEFQ